MLCSCFACSVPRILACCAFSKKNSTITYATTSTVSQKLPFQAINVKEITTPQIKPGNQYFGLIFLYIRNSGIRINWAGTRAVEKDIPLNGYLAFRVPTNEHPQRLSNNDYDILVDKMTSRIRVWYTKSLSYAARLQLVNSVLMSISTYWCMIFLLPKCMNAKDAICRAFLWHADANNTNPGNVNLQKLCLGKKERGLGIRNLEVWNIV